jgi:hypothetical protein
MKTSLPTAPPPAAAPAGRAPAVPRGIAGEALPASVSHALRRVIARQLSVKLGECAALLLACVPALWLCQALADGAFNLPWLVRGCLLLGDLALAVYLLAVYAVRPWRRKLTLPTAALLVERALPEYRSALISAVQLSQVPSGSPALARALIAGVARRLQGGGFPGRVVDTRHLKVWSRWALASTALTLGAFCVAAPKSHVLLGRLLLSRQPLPTRTAVIAISGDAVVPLGADLSLSARAQGVIPEGGRLLLIYANGQQGEIPAPPRTDDSAVFAVALKNVQQSFHYHFQLGDGTGADFQVAAQVSPALAAVKFTQTYPAYTGRRATEMSAGNLSLLAGSRIQVQGRATQSLRSATLRFEGTSLPTAQMRVSGAEQREFAGEFVVPKEGLTGFSVRFVNTAGVASTDNTVYHVDFVPDHPPAVELTAPAADRATVSSNAQATLRFSVRDDFGIKQIALRYEVRWPAAPAGKGLPGAGEMRLPFPAGATSFDGVYVWELGKQQPALSAGCTVEYWVEAVDNNDVTGPGIGQSAKKTLVVVSEQEKRAELLERLGASATGIQELYQRQVKANEELNANIRQKTP